MANSRAKQDDCKHAANGQCSSEYLYIFSSPPPQLVTVKPICNIHRFCSKTDRLSFTSCFLFAFTCCLLPSIFHSFTAPVCRSVAPFFFLMMFTLSLFMVFCYKQIAELLWVGARWASLFRASCECLVQNNSNDSCASAGRVVVFQTKALLCVKGPLDETPHFQIAHLCVIEQKKQCEWVDKEYLQSTV